MDLLGTGGNASNGVRESAGRGVERLVESNTIASPRDHPMLQIGSSSSQSQEVKKTHYPYKEPRIDQRMYQADIPVLQGGDSNRAVTRGSSSPRAGEEAVCPPVGRIITAVPQNPRKPRRGLVDVLCTLGAIRNKLRPSRYTFK